MFSYYHVRKPRQFDHKPIYWDPHKEEMEKRLQRIKRELGQSEPLTPEESKEEYNEEIKNAFHEGTSHLKRSKEKGNNPRTREYKNVKLILALVVLAVILWYLMH